jgi:long-chain acyl-CoA synthetase
MLLRMRSLPPEIRDAFDLTSMQAIVVGGAPVPQALKEWVLDRFGDVLYESYASTETGAITSLVPGDARRKPGSSGRPFDQVLIRIVDDEWHQLPVGTTGEIAVKTPVLIARYLGGADLDGATMSDDGFFRTGDVGHVDEDGFLFITDRRKDMIVAGGVNIYPAEIEAAILEHPSVLDCAVVGIPHSDFGEQPMAFVELRPGATVTAEELIGFLERGLAPYKRPRAIEFVTDLPRNPSGKVLKYELRAPYWRGREKAI